MNKYVTENIPITELHFDANNPRLAEFDLTSKASEEEILKLLWETMSIDEIILSIASSGYFAHEPLIVIDQSKKNTKQKDYVVIEGNRRLAAVRSILNPKIISNYSLNQKSIAVPRNIVKELDSLPCIIVNSREEAWRYIGFKHINGPAKWGSFAKAQYIAQIRNEFSIPLEKIAVQIGDTHKTVQKLYQGLMVLEQAEKAKVYRRDDVSGSRLYFSHLYTAITYEGIKLFIGLESGQEDVEQPIPKNKIENLKELLIWLFGSKKMSIEPVVRTQNPDLRRLDSVVKKKEATMALRNGSPLLVAYELSQPSDEIFETNLILAKQHLQKAQSFVSFAYKGERGMLETADDINNLASNLYEIMNKKFEEIKKIKSGKQSNKA